MFGMGTGVASSLLPPKIEVSVSADPPNDPEGSDLGQPAVRRQFRMPTKIVTSKESGVKSEE